VSAGDLILPCFEIAAQTRVLSKIDQPTIVGEGIDDTLTAPLHFTGQDVTGSHQRQLSIRLHVERVKVPYKRLVRPGRNTNSDLASRFLDGRKLLLNAADQRRLIR